MNIQDIKSIEDFIAFKYQHEDLFALYVQEENRETPEILIPLKGILTPVKLLDAQVVEEVIPESPDSTLFEMTAIIGLPFKMEFIDTKGNTEITDTITFRNSCISPAGCMDLDWSNVSCAWDPEIS